MLRKNDIVDVEIIGMGCNMEGIAKHDGVVLFVPFAIVGEKVRVKIINTKQKAYVCKIIELLEKSPYRTIPQCPYFGKCGGCQSQHILYQESLNFKREQVQNAITHIGKENIKVLPCIPSENDFRYRNKLAFPINPETKKVGMYKAYSHDIVDIDDCLIQEKWAKDYIDCIDLFIAKTNISIYNEEDGKGILRHIVGRHYGGKYLFTIVINGEKLPNIEVLIDIIKEKFEKFGLSININKEKSNVIMTQNFINIYGFESIDIEEFGVNYSINNASFMQVNNDIKHKIYSAVLDEVGKDDILIDAYSGAGLLTAICSKKCKFAYGIEIVGPAVDSANELMRANNISNMKNYCGDSAKILPKLIKEIKGKKTVVLDPPRKGCDKKVMEALAESCPEKIVYISCNPSTLARDIYNLKSACPNYDVISVRPYDMFPCTKHVETLAVLKLRGM